MAKDDRISLRHMLDAAREATHSVAGHSRSELESNVVWTLGLVKCIEIIGEAAGRIGKETQAKYAGIPWTEIVAMRNRLVHAYFDIDLDQLWKTITEDLPPLVADLENALKKEEGNGYTL